MISSGPRVVRASSAEAGLALMDREDIDVLVTDVQLPGLGGLDLLHGAPIAVPFSA